MQRSGLAAAPATVNHRSALDRAYARCRALHRQHGHSYYLATRLLPPWRRKHVHALYGFTRYTDEIVDGAAADDRATALSQWAEAFWARVDRADPILPAVWDTIDRFSLDPTDFALFLASMKSDLKPVRFQTYAELLVYMSGSAAAVGTMMLPVLGMADGVDPAQAVTAARHLGYAFQLTNFIRDVAEDYHRGRVYLPQVDLARCGVSETDLAEAVARHAAPKAVKALVQYEIERARRHYALAIPGVAMLAPASRRCISAAYQIYGEILTEVARADYDVFGRRAVVPKRRRLALAGRALVAPHRLEVPCA